MTAAAKTEPVATILITTRDRCAQLFRALRSALAQTVEAEFIVLDDGSRDGTYEKVRSEFPTVRLLRSEEPIGCPAQRNRGFAVARGAVVVCLDDDAFFSSPNTLAQVLAEFDHPHIGVVTIPYVNIRREHWQRQRSPDERRWAAGTFAGGASALRRDPFLAAGGYADFREHGEETDLAVRLLDRGFFVRLGRADHIVHDEARLTKPARAFAYSSRNHLLEAWRNTPWPYLPARLAVVAAKVIYVGITGGQARPALDGVAAAARSCAAGRVPRAAVRRRTHVLTRKLHRRGPLLLDEAICELRGSTSLHSASRGKEAPFHILSILTSHAAGGAEYAAVDMLDALARRGASVRLLTNRVELVEGTRVEAVELDLGPKLRRRTLARAALGAPMSLARLVRGLREQAPFDVLLVHFKKEQLLSTVLPRSITGAVVWAEWGPLPRQLRAGPPRLAYALAARRAAAIIAESDRTARSLAGAAVDPARIVVVPNVLDSSLAFDAVARDEQRAAWGLQDAFVLGCISRLDPAKRVDVAIDALAHLGEEVALVIAGEGEHEKELRRRAAPYGSRVRFVGNIRGRVGRFLSACDVQVYAPGPSEGEARAVTFGQLVERPVIATGPEGAEALVVPGTGTIVSPAHDPRALAQAVDAYCGDPSRVREEGAAGRRRAMRRIADANALEVLERTLRDVSR